MVQILAEEFGTHGIFCYQTASKPIDWYKKIGAHSFQSFILLGNIVTICSIGPIIRRKPKYSKSATSSYYSSHDDMV